MNICLTFDYEIFFGEKAGSVEKCLLIPTQRLLEIFESHKIHTTFFIDASYLLSLKSDSKNNPHSDKEFKLISEQINKLVQNGHEIGLHIHPHWMDSYRCGIEWKMNTERYRFNQWDREVQEEHFLKACTILREFYPSLISFRAGGWCIQPFSEFHILFRKNKLSIDSSVVPGFRIKGWHHQFDFAEAPSDLSVWKFSGNPCKPVKEGIFYEVPVTPDIIYPFHQYTMFFLHRLNSAQHLPLGDGSWIKENLNHYIKYFLPFNHYVSTDGYFASRLKMNYLKKTKKSIKCLTTLGHPKSMSEFSFAALNEFIVFTLNKGSHFKTIKELALESNI